MAISALTLLDKGQLVIRLGALAIQVAVELRLMYQDSSFPRAERQERLGMVPQYLGLVASRTAS
jgi:hypothetical protein